MSYSVIGMWSVRIFLTSESVEPGLSDSKTVYSTIWWWILIWLILIRCCGGGGGRGHDDFMNMMNVGEIGAYENTNENVLIKILIFKIKL